ncbi:hypothetical protein [Acinetobacter towneri]|uniref:hypothetical protein n=1 Tax=Acinetobacter towneri TaxID=202956 RepID=UPI001F1FA0AE|nr:hypothetical protein [Acinetobacter towneri]UIP24845.1 hypothetical protein LZG54_12095 [Acinetobacter towneri]
MEQAERFQCLKLEHQQLHPIAWQSLQPQFAEIYADVLKPLKGQKTSAYKNKTQHN